MHSTKFLKVKRYYDAGFWNAEMVCNAVAKDWITADEYTEITGEDFVN